MTKRTITVGQAIDRILKIRKDRIVAADEAAQKVLARFSAREAEYLAGLTQSVKERALAMVDAEYDVGHAPPAAMAPVEEDAPAPDETPSRPTLEEYDARGVMEPLPQERLAVGRKR